MRFLCLHGYGTSSEIWEQQFSTIAQALGHHHEYVYIDGEIDVTRTELAGLYQGKTLAFYDGCDSRQVEQAHDLIAEYLEAEIAEGRSFDAIIANSQGASLTISYLLHQQIIDPDAPLPFRFAVLFTPGVIISPDASYKTPEIRSFLDRLDRGDLDGILRALLDSQGRIVIDAEKFTGLGNLDARQRELCLTLCQHTSALLSTRRSFRIAEESAFPDLTAMVDAKDEFPRFFHPVYTSERIKIPTVHVLGAEEVPAVKRLADIAKRLCDSDRIVEVIHRGGHEVPNQRSGVEDVVRAIEKADFMSSRW